jgi:hypothetical protein
VPGKTSAPLYRVTFRLLTVVFDIVGYVAETDLLDIDPAMISSGPCCRSGHLNTQHLVASGSKIFTCGLRLVTASAGCAMPEA